MKILLVEDELKVAAFIQKGLEEQAHQIEMAHDGETGRKMALNNSYDIVILDVNLPILNGLEACRQIRLQKKELPILMLTAMGTVEDKVAGLDRGADDYLVKPFSFKELLARINALTRRNSSVLKKEVLKVLDLEMDLASKTVKRNGVLVKLTAREFLLLELFIRNKNIVLSRAEIAEKIWNIDFDTGTNVIDVYVNYLRNKIDKMFEIKLIHTVVGMGYVLKDEN